MRDTLSASLRKLSQNKNLRSRLTALLLVLSVFVVGAVFYNLRQTGITLAGDADCGIVDHTHTADCESRTLICTLSDEPHVHTDDCYTTEETTTLVCTLTDQPHVHTDGCYTTVFVEGHEEQTLVCTEDHDHSDGCYITATTEGCEEQVLNCDLTSEPHEHTADCYSVSQSDPVLVCTLSDQPHVHTDECYEITYICGMEEHVHTADCYSDDTADVETQLDWQRMFRGYDSGDLPYDLVAVAESQIGYCESTRNFRTGSDGQRRGYTRYGDWYGLPYSDWSAMFVSFCLNYAGSSDSDTLYNTGADSMARLWDRVGLFSSDADPMVGDLVFFDDNTVGIISAVRGSSMNVIMGDVDGCVAQLSVSADSRSITGYGLVTPPEERGSADDPDTYDLAPSDESSGGLTIAWCDCGNTEKDAIGHADSCAYKSQLKSLANGKTAQELCDLWSQLPGDGQSYILTYLGWNNTSKLDELNSLLGPQSGGLTATVGTAQFSVSGTGLPVDVSLVVSDPDYTQSQTLSYVNPNNQDLVHWSKVYDISLTSEYGAKYTPTGSVTVTVTDENFKLGADELFCVAHLDEKTGSVISSQYVSVSDDGTITFETDSFSPYLFYRISAEAEGGERILGTNWMTLRDSGWFEYWSSPSAASVSLLSDGAAAVTLDPTDSNNELSDSQVSECGGTTVSGDEKVTVSKTIDGTDLENVFDITLTVTTTEEISEIYNEPDMAVVIVMDISNTMNDNFGGVTRYAAAMESAEKFIDKFAENNNIGMSKIGYVAFNTDAHKIFELQKCTNETEANTLKNTMRTATGSIINADGYGVAHNRFTNIEAGLKMASDMLSGVSNKNKFIILLTDGFPTTYISSGYKGYDPYTSSGTTGADGVFFDSVLKVYCGSGTSYSDKAAIRARKMATTIKSSGIDIFSIGVDIGGQTIQKFIETSEKLVASDAKISVVDRTDTTYEIGDATSADAYKNWLKCSIGSGEGYYYDSTDTEGLQNAYTDIFKKILKKIKESSDAEWVAQDPLPSSTSSLIASHHDYVEFIGFFDKSGNLTLNDLKGEAEEGGENNAGHLTDDDEVTWDLKHSGYSKTTTVDGTTYYSYKITYRVRLKNEVETFMASKSDNSAVIYATNDETTLTYKVTEEIDGQTTLSEEREVNFQIPSVHGYLGELNFTKTDSGGTGLAGAEFTLSHDTATCSACRGDGVSSVYITPSIAMSGEDGSVSFVHIPSGHTYTLVETKPPDGYVSDGNSYSVNVKLGKVTVTVKDKSGNVLTDLWDNKIVNIKNNFVLPATGGTGTAPYFVFGLLIIGIALIAACRRRGKTKKAIRKEGYK